MEVAYVGPLYDSSGYAEAARNNIAALDIVGVKVKPEIISFEAGKTTHKLGKLIEQLSTAHGSLSPAIRIIHCTPDNYPKLIQKWCYNIGYAAWETSKLPNGWAERINLLDEIWVPSNYNVQAFRDSGVTVPIKCIPHTFDTTTRAIPENTKKVFERSNPDEFVFYSIFQWLERKNPIGLLKAYLSEFTREDNVVLVLKTFLFDHNSQVERDRIRETILGVKQKTYLPSLPKLLLITDLLSSDEMAKLHQDADCCVHLARSEGFGIPIVEAMLASKPVITTNYGGPQDFLASNVGYPVWCIETPVYGMPWPIYTSNMSWAEPDLMHARRLMRHVYAHREEASCVGQLGRDHIKGLFSWDTVGQLMKNRLEEIGNQA